MADAKPRRRWKLWIPLILLFLLIDAVGMHYFMGVKAERELRQTVEAVRASGEPIAPQDFHRPPVPDAQNAALDIRTADEAINRESQEKEAYDTLRTPPRLPLTDEERSVLRALVAQNAGPLRRLRDARAKPSADWRLDFSRTPMMDMLLPVNGPKELAEIAAANALISHEAGDDREAVECVRDLLMLARHLDGMPMVVGHLVSVGVSAMAADRLEQITPALKVGDGGASREQVKAVIAELLDERTMRDGLIQAFRGDRASTLQTITLMQRGQYQPAVSKGRGGAQPPVPSRIKRYLAKPKLLNEAATGVRVMTRVIANAQQATWPAYNASVPGLSAELEADPGRSQLVSILMPAVHSAVNRHFRVLAERRLAASALALKLYAADHAGRMPATLDQLVPDYLPSVPADPFSADARALGFRPDGERPMIYSVGEDGRDDGGSDKPVAKKAYHRWQRQDAIFDLRLAERPRDEEESDVE